MTDISSIETAEGQGGSVATTGTIGLVRLARDEATHSTATGARVGQGAGRGVETLDKGSPVPLWYQLRRVLEGRIAGGKVRINQSIGTEAELASEFRIGRATVRRALAELERDGWVERRGLRQPLAVCRRASQEAGRMAGLFSEAFLAQGAEVKIRVVSAEKVGDNRIAPRLGLEVEAELCRVERIFEVDAEPVALEVAWLVADRLPGLCGRALDEPLTALVEREYGLTYSSAEQRLSARLPTATEAERLHIESPVVVISIVRTSADQYGQPLEYMESALRADRYDFVMTIP